MERGQELLEPSRRLTLHAASARHAVPGGHAQIVPFGCSTGGDAGDRTGAHIGGYFCAAAEALAGGQGPAAGEDALTSCLPVRQVLIVYRAGPWSGPAWPGIRTR